MILPLLLLAPTVGRLPRLLQRWTPVNHTSVPTTFCITYVLISYQEKGFAMSNSQDLGYDQNNAQRSLR